jgi:MraZ protein
MMKLFISSSTHKVDKKGRVSIPATFRKVLEGEAESGVVLGPTLREQPCVEGYGYGRLEQLAAQLDQLNPLSEEYEALAGQVLGRAKLVSLDPEGRIVLPAEFIERAHITTEAVFVGLGKTFQIWSPDLYASHRDTMRGVAQAHADKLPWGALKPAGSGS